MPSESPQSLEQLSRSIAEGRCSPVDAVEQCLERIREREAEVLAWAYLAETEAGEQARQLTEELRSSGPRGPLHGIPFGVKDIYDTAGMPTEWGTPVHKGRVPAADAALVARLKQAGAIVLGKTHTTAYAYFDPAPTRNPHNPAHTPGGSSSGSAAAVADGMVPFALGSQTQGSVLRPASFCGITGFKPSHGCLPVEGVMPFAPTLDHPGPFTRTVDDMLFLWAAMNPGHDPADGSAEKPGEFRFAAPPWPIEGALDPEMQTCFDAYLGGLDERGFDVERVSLPNSLNTLPENILTVMNYEAAQIHGEDFRRHGAKIGRKLALLIEEGLAIGESAYQQARAALDKARAEFAAAVSDGRIWITAAALGPAPASLETTGDPRCNSPFTALGVPSISFPFATARNGLPLGLQLAAGRDEEARLLAAASQLAKS